MYIPSREMDYHHCWQSIILLFLSCILISSSSTAAFVSGGRDGILEWRASTGRSILQAREDCPINIELLNYTNITSQCKEPYEAQPCCAAFAELACPHADLLNNLTYKCSDRLFTYLGVLRYPQGLFSNLCTVTKQGIPCPAPPPTVADDAPRLSNRSHVLMFVSLFLLLLKLF